MTSFHLFLTTNYTGSSLANYNWNFDNISDELKFDSNDKWEVALKYAILPSSVKNITNCSIKVQKEDQELEVKLSPSTVLTEADLLSKLNLLINSEEVLNFLGTEQGICSMTWWKKQRRFSLRLLGLENEDYQVVFNRQLCGKLGFSLDKFYVPSGRNPEFKATEMSSLYNGNEMMLITSSLVSNACRMNTSHAPVLACLPLHFDERETKIYSRFFGTRNKIRHELTALTYQPIGMHSAYRHFDIRILNEHLQLVSWSSVDPSPLLFCLHFRKIN